MCLDCEMDALWFPEIEAAARASSPLSVRKKSPLSASETSGRGLWPSPSVALRGDGLLK